MNKTDIEWADYTWNPVTGCLHECPYCYARRIAYRFGLDFSPRIGDPGFYGCKYDSSEGLDTMMELDKPYRRGGKIEPYPMAFYPTFHRYKLKEPARKATGATIFVSSMGDLFGDWVPDEWIRQVFAACAEAPQHRYLFLTKAPGRYLKLMSLLPEAYGTGRLAFWWGTTVTTKADAAKRTEIMRTAGSGAARMFLSVEPLHEDLAGAIDYGAIKWLIVGAETGSSKEKIVPPAEWITKLVWKCRERGIPIFMKDSVADIIGPDNMLRQLPEGITLLPKGGRARV